MSETATLRRPVRRLLKDLRFRESLGECYVVHSPRGRCSLVVPTMYGTARGNLSWLRAFAWGTVREAIRDGLVEVPDGSRELRYDYRRRGDSTSGEVIRLTDAGRRLVDGAKPSP